jgi:D-alanyl-D-alanine carboxypeptidase/D-alanyl-D-alanine-endopeptidase (penicillin-binding protein 4)
MAVPRLATRLIPLLALLIAMPTRADPGPLDSALAPLRTLEAGARVGAVFAVDGREVAALHGDVLLNPASVTKLFTAAVALRVLGLDRTFPTTVSAVGDGPQVDALVVTPGGDPTLEGGDLQALARCVRDKGVTAAGDLVVEAGAFTAESDPPAYDRKGTLAPYRAGIAAFVVDRGAVTVTVSPSAPGTPPRVALSSVSDRVIVVNDAVTAGAVAGKRKAAKGRAAQAAKDRAGAPGRFLLSGEVDREGRLVLHLAGAFKSKQPVVQSFRVPDPGAHAAGAFRTHLEAVGVKLSAGPGLAAAPGTARVLCTREGPTLAAILLPMLKDSVNPYAETVLRLVGSRDADGRPVGFAEGARALSAFLKDPVGLSDGAFRFANGSGLYDANAVSARGTVALLRWLHRAPKGGVVLDALPVAGVDGTLKKRLKGTPLAGRLRAKTGTLDDAVTLAGILPLAGGRVLQFAVLVNAPECTSEAAARGRCQALDRSAARKATDETLLAVWMALDGH